VKNITVTVPDEVYRAARVRAAETGTSVSSLVADFLRTLTEDDVEFDRLAVQQRRVTKTLGRFSATDRLGRAEVHDRAVR
jgi:plasmid stability protein